MSMKSDPQFGVSTVSQAEMPGIRPMLRVHMELRAGSLLAVLERLQIAGQSPRLMMFHREQDAAGRLILDFDKVNEPTAQALMSWLERLTGVLSVTTEWRPSRTPPE